MDEVVAGNEGSVEDVVTFGAGAGSCFGGSLGLPSWLVSAGHCVFSSEASCFAMGA